MPSSLLRHCLQFPLTRSSHASGKGYDFDQYRWNGNSSG